MEMYFIILAMSGFLVIISFYAGAITYKHVKTTRNSSLGALVLSWFSWTLSYMSVIIAFIVESYYPHDVFIYWTICIIGSFFFQILGVFNLILFIDQNSNSRISVVKITIISIIGSLYIILPLVTEQLKFSPMTIYTLEDTLRWVQTAFGLYYFMLYIVWIYRIWKNSPKDTKRMTTVLLIIFMSSSIVAIIAYVISGYDELQMIFLYIFHAGAILSIVIAVRIDPRIINILPFAASRLLVINKTSGVLIYEYDWSDERQQNLASFIHGIQRVSQETFQVGELKALYLDEGLVILDYSKEITYALLTSKSTKYLQLCFQNFKEDFEKELKKSDLKVDGVINTADFEFGDKLVKNYFKYIPLRRAKPAPM